MSSIPTRADGWPRRRGPAGPGMTGWESLPRLRTLGMALRSVFVVSLVIVIAHVSMPQSANIWTTYASPGDLIRLALGFMVCVWLAVQLFVVPTDVHAYRTWLYLGLAAVPFAVICIVGIW